MSEKISLDSSDYIYIIHLLNVIIEFIFSRLFLNKREESFLLSLFHR